MTEAYGNDQDFQLEDILETRLLDDSKQYFEGPVGDGDDRNYNLAFTTSSDFVFRGAQPGPRSVFDTFDKFDLVEFGKSLWVENPEPGQDIWVFDNVAGVGAIAAN